MAPRRGRMLNVAISGSYYLIKILTAANDYVYVCVYIYIHIHSIHIDQQPSVRFGYLKSWQTAFVVIVVMTVAVKF
jgi:hypothetical protein